MPNTDGEHASLWALGVLLAVYDGAEVVLKPMFGALCDRVGPRPVLLAGLVAFAGFSLAFVIVANPALVGLARLGQGAAAAAYSPAAGVLLARLAPPTRQGRAFGYGMFKTIGYTIGPLFGGALVTLDGFPLLFATLGVLAVAIAIWAAIAVPAAAPLPRARHTVADLTRHLRGSAFLAPTACLAATTAALAVGIGFLALRGATAGLNPVQTGIAVSLLAAASALVQPFAGRARDAARLSDTAAMAGGLLLAAAGLAIAALLPGLVGLLGGELVIGIGVGVATPLGFAALAAHTDPARLGQTMCAAEVGRELGDAGGPLLVAAMGTLATFTSGSLGLAVLLTAAGAAISRTPTLSPNLTPKLTPNVTTRHRRSGAPPLTQRRDATMRSDPVNAPPRPTRRALLRALTSAGALAASASLLNGCGAGAHTAPSGALPPPGHTGALIMIIRHGEKPPASGLPQGVDAGGQPDIHSLTTRGWARAGALFELFAPANGTTHPGLARPTAIYAAGGTAGDGLRTRQTVTPLAARLNLRVNTQFSKGDETGLADEVATRTEPTLICWQHGELPAIAATLGNVTPSPPALWPDDRYDLVWTLTPAAAGWSFHQIPELRLPGDSNQSIA